MQSALEEIRDLLQSSLTDGDLILSGNTVPLAGETVAVFLAQPSSPSKVVIQPKTNTGDVAAGAVTVNGTDESDAVIAETVTFEANDTRARFTEQLFKTVTSIVWPAQDGATATWDVGIARFKKYYVGKIQFPPVNYMPILMIYPVTTEVRAATTATDTSIYSLAIEIVVNIYQYADPDGIDTDHIGRIQKAICELMEERDTDNSPKANTVLGAIRANITGADYNFNRNIDIQYEEEIEKGVVFYRARMLLQAYRDHTR